MPARNHKGERIIIFVGLIDILQSYRLIKKLEHTFKAMIHDGVSKSRKQANNWAMILRTRSPFTGLASTPSDSWRLCRRKSSRRFPHVSDDHSGKPSLTPHHPPLSQRCGATPTASACTKLLCRLSPTLAPRALCAGDTPGIWSGELAMLQMS